MSENPDRPDFRPHQDWCAHHLGRPCDCTPRTQAPRAASGQVVVPADVFESLKRDATNMQPDAIGRELARGAMAVMGRRYAEERAELLETIQRQAEHIEVLKRENQRLAAANRALQAKVVPAAERVR